MKNIIVSSFILLFSLSSSFAEDGKDIVEKYISAIIDGDLTAAEYCWHKDVIKASKRLGITYPEVPLKADLDSPVIAFLEELRLGWVKYKISDTVIKGEWLEVEIELTDENNIFKHQYVLINTDDGLRLSSPVLIHTVDWGIIETEFTEIHFSDRSKINKFAIDELDDFIEETLNRFSCQPELTKKLRTVKIPYYLCNEAEIELLTGHNCQGMGKLGLDAVISRHLPHKHEIVHLLINYILRESPLYVLPFMQEGTAVAIGGRWGKSHEVLMQMGNFLLRSEFINMNSILTFDSFHFDVASPDLTYPVSGLLVGFLMEKLGSDKFKSLYINLSGDNRQIRKYSEVYIKNKIRSATGLPWNRLVEDFTDWYKKYEFSGILPDCFKEEYIDSSSLDNDGYTVKILESRGEYSFIITGKDEFKGGTILLYSEEKPSNSRYKSWMLEEQISADYDDCPNFGITFTKDEAGLYDYFTNTLIAKYVLSFNPSEEYVHPSGQSISFSVDKELIFDLLKKYRLELVAPGDKR